MRPLFAFLVGVIADKLMSNKAIPILFILLIAGSSLLLINPSLVPLGLTFVFIALTASGIYGIRAIYFALIKESKIPLFATGSAVGIISFLGYTPDVFMSPIIGFLIDNNPGFQGYNYVFLLLTGLSFVGLSAAAMLYYKLQIQATPE
jgi:sugar phosphate permease